MARSLREKPGMHSYFPHFPSMQLKMSVKHCPFSPGSLLCSLQTFHRLSWGDEGRSLRRGDGNQPRLHASLERSSKEFFSSGSMEIVWTPKNIKKGIMECVYHETLHLISKVLVNNWLVTMCQVFCWVLVLHKNISSSQTHTHIHKTKKKKTN